ncbi:patatin-like phospholipase family protein [Synechocystis sp. PCC 7509]|uniref:patatin-like phospholipase family protein n=1 Tax=Synechocystis sp. PCC 7509 TaxID=927677 RepID=UPI0002ABD715|nr:patatin-like phospholipase family protein [Synechocystis sp. PCC 7509]
MKSIKPKIGLVLAGGGAKGAYQVGALKYLSELGIVPQIIAGTSIGALNGAVLATHSPFPDAVNRLSEMWQQLGKAPILRPNTGTVSQTFSYAAQTFVPTLREWVLDFLVQQGLIKDRSAIFDPAPIEQLLRDSVDPANFANGIELWVTVFPSLKIPGLGYDWLIDFVRAKTGTDSHWLCVQDFRDTETIYNLLLASAAIPLAFPSRKVNGKAYVDGALADNVPLKALAARGCTHAIVIHLCNGAVWSRHDFPEQTIIEIRPEQPIDSSDNLFLGSISSLLNFKSDRIYELQQQGYNDAERCLKPIIQTLINTKNQRLTHDALANSTQSLLEDLPL